MQSGKCKWKQQGGTITNILEWPKPSTLITIIAGEDVEQHEFSLIAGDNAKWYSSFGRQFGDAL